MTRKSIVEIQREIDEENRLRDNLLNDLEVPHYSNRTLEADRVKSIVGRTLTGKYGWSMLAPQEVVDLLTVGDPYILETYGSIVTGWIINGRWYGRKSDQDLDRDRQMLAERIKERTRKQIEEHREEWTRREAALPEWAKAEMTIARERNKNFESEPMGWGYTLVILELAVIYASFGSRINVTDIREIDEEEVVQKFATAHGTSGYQHFAAFALAREHVRDRQLHTFVKDSVDDAVGRMIIDEVINQKENQ